MTNAFYAYENLVVAAAEAHNLEWARNHYKKADLARDLFKRKVLSKDLGDELLRMNDLRKDVSYGEPGAELSEEDLEGLVTELEQVIDEIEGMISCLEEDALAEDEEDEEEEEEKSGESNGGSDIGN